MNAEKLKRLQAQVRIGGKGTPRRKKKVTHQTAATDDKKLQSSLKKLSVSTIPGIEEVNIIKDDLTVIHFNNPKAQASLSANTFAVTGHGETKKIVEMLPEILPQLGQETVAQLRMFANSMSSGQNQIQKPADDFADDVPLLVEDFDQIAKQEASSESKAKLNTKPKNKSKATVEDQQKKNDKQPMLGQKIQTNAIAIDEKATENVAIKAETVNQKPSDQATQGVEKGKVSYSEKAKSQKEPKKEAQKESKQPKHETTAANKKNVENQETNKIKETNQKESLQANKNNSPKEGQQSKKNQNTKQQPTVNEAAAPSKEITSIARDIKIAASKEAKGPNNTKDGLNISDPLLLANNQGEEKCKSAILSPPTSEISKPDETVVTQVDKTAANNTTSEVVQPKLETKEPIKVVALPTPPIIPPKPIEVKLSPEVKADSKVNAPELEPKFDSVKLEDLNKGNVANVVKDDKNVSETKAPIEIVAKESIIVEVAKPSENLIEVSPLKSTKPQEDKSEKLPQNDGIAKKGTIAPENQDLVTKRNEKPIASSQQKMSGAAKQQSIQKPISSKEAMKKPAPQQQKPTLESKKLPPNSENKKEGEKPKGKQNIVKPQSANTNNAPKSQPTHQTQQQVKKTTSPSQASSENTNGAAKPQQVPSQQQKIPSVSEGSPAANTTTISKPETQKSQQQQVPKTPATTQASGKPNEKPAGTTKQPATTTKTSPAVKKPAPATPTAGNTKPGSSASNPKTKTNPTANKPRDPVAQVKPKADKAQGNANTGGPPTKTVDQQTKSPKGDTTPATTPVEKQ